MPRWRAGLPVRRRRLHVPVERNSGRSGMTTAALRASLASNGSALCCRSRTPRTRRLGVLPTTRIRTRWATSTAHRSTSTLGLASFRSRSAISAATEPHPLQGRRLRPLRAPVVAVQPERARRVGRGLRRRRDRRRSSRSSALRPVTASGLWAGGTAANSCVSSMSMRARTRGLGRMSVTELRRLRHRRGTIRGTN